MNLFRNWLARTRATLGKSRSPRPFAYHPCIENLETRLVPAGPPADPRNLFVENERADQTLNNTFDTATDISANIELARADVLTTPKNNWRTVQGDISKATIVYLGGEVDQGDDDYYKITYNAGKFGLFLDIDSRASKESLTLNGVLELYDANRNSLFKSTYMNDDILTGENGFDPAMYRDLPAGTYFVRVSGSAGSGNYSLRTLIDTNYTANTVVPVLNSLPGAAATLYLDFDGYTGKFTGDPAVDDAYIAQPSNEPEWKALRAGAKQFTLTTINLKGAGHEGDQNTFSPAERLFIQNTWRGAAEYFSPYNINVTTVKPAQFGKTPTRDAQGNITYTGANGGTYAVIANAENAVLPKNQKIGGGYAWVDTYQKGDPSYQGSHNFILPNVRFEITGRGYFNDNTAAFTKNAAAAGYLVAHEQGHIFGLEHQFHKDVNGESNVVPAVMNYAGANDARWASGVNSSGKLDANGNELPGVLQDDVAIITKTENGFGYRPDDHANAAAMASTLTQAGNVFTGKGVIEKFDDVDFFRFTGSGKTTITVTPETLARLSMLDAVVTLLDANGATVVAAPAGQFKAVTLTSDLAPGEYFLQVRSTGKTRSGKADVENYLYSQGQYQVEVQTTAGNNAAPTLTANGANAVTFTENRGPVSVVANVTLADADSPNWNGGRLTASIIQNGGAADQLLLVTDQVVRIEVGQVRYNGLPVATVTGGTGGAPLVIQFTSEEATLAVAQAIFQRIAFTIPGKFGGADTTARTVQLDATDRQGTAGTPATTTVNLVASNDPPVVAVNIGLTVNNGGTHQVAKLNLSATDTDQGPALLTYTLQQLPVAGRLVFNGNPVVAGTTFTQADIDNNLVQYVHTATAVLADQFTFTVVDGVGGFSPLTTFNIRVRTATEPLPVTNLGITARPGKDVEITKAILEYQLPAAGAGNPPRTFNLQFKVVEAPKLGKILTRQNGAATEFNNFFQTTIDRGNLFYQAPTAAEFAAFKKNNPGVLTMRLVFTVQDDGTPGAQTDNQFFTITLIDENAAPVVAAFTPSLSPTSENIPFNSRNPQDVDELATNGGNLVSEMLRASKISDQNNDAKLGIAITDAFSTNGIWEYTTDRGATWQPIGAVSDAHALLLSGDTDCHAVRFCPNPLYVGPVRLAFRAWDGTTGVNGGYANATTVGGTSPFSSVVANATLQVCPCEEPPSFTGTQEEVVVHQNAGAVVLDDWAMNLKHDASNNRSFFFEVEPDNNFRPDEVPLSFLSGPEIGADCKLRFEVAPNSVGERHFFVFLSDGISRSEGFLLSIHVHAVNQAPSFTRGADQTAGAAAGPQSVAGWATGLGAGSANEAGQVLHFLVTNNNPALFAVQPALAADGTLTYTPSPTAFGTATVSVCLVDNGGTEENGHDISQAQTFTIAITGWQNALVAPPGNSAVPVDPVNDVRDNLRDLYWVILGREAATAELAAWVRRTDTGDAWANVVRSFWESEEHRAIELRSYYQNLLGRSASAAEIQVWLPFFKAGAREEDVTRAFLNSAEYQSGKQGNAAFVRGLYQAVAGRSGSAAEVAGWVRTLEQGISRDAVVLRFLRSEETVELAVGGYYQIYLGRRGAAREVALWVSAQSRLGLGEMAQAFLTSLEFMGNQRS